MAKITWDNKGERYYETGVKKGVLYVYDSSKKAYGTGVAWNGLTAVTESPSGAEATALYADDIKYLSLLSAEEFGATIEAYTYPEEFAACNGEMELGEKSGVYAGQQTRSKFAFCYRSTVGNDNGTEGYKLHIIYDCHASPSEKAYATINDSPEAITFSFEVTTDPVSFTFDGKECHTSIITIDSTKCDTAKLTALENKLYGTDSDEPTLQLPDDIYSILAGTATTESTEEE